MNEELAMRSLAYLMRDYKEQDEVMLNDDDIEAIKYLQQKYEQLQNNWNELKKFVENKLRLAEEDDVDDEELKGYLIQRRDTFKEVYDEMQEMEQGKDENN